MKFFPVGVPEPRYTTLNTPSRKPFTGEMKNWMPRLAWMSVRFLMSVGLSSGEPRAVLKYVPVSESCAREVEMLLPDPGRSGVLLYRYSSSCTDSTYSPAGPPSRSRIDRPTSDVDGS